MTFDEWLETKGSEAGYIEDLEPIEAAWNAAKADSAQEIKRLRADLEAVEAWFVEGERTLNSPRVGVLFSLGAWWERRPRNRQRGLGDSPK